MVVHMAVSLALAAPTLSSAVSSIPAVAHRRYRGELHTCGSPGTAVSSIPAAPHCRHRSTALSTAGTACTAAPRFRFSLLGAPPHPCPSRPRQFPLVSFNLLGPSFYPFQPPRSLTPYPFQPHRSPLIHFGLVCPQIK